MLAVHKPRGRAILIIAFVAVVPSILAWIAWSDPRINFLPRDARAEWIVFPTAVNAKSHGSASFDATFRREFVLPDLPPTTRLSIRAMRGAEVQINGSPVLFLPNTNWKKIRSADVAEQLHIGTNVIEARVFNHNGPPALWLNLAADQLNLRTDQSWEVSYAGSSWRAVALATAAKTTRPGNLIAGN